MSYFDERYDPPDGEEDAGRWQVHISLTSQDLEALRLRAGAVMPTEHLDFHTELVDGREGEPALAIRVQASTAEEAIGEAGHVYRKLRAAADLPVDNAPSILGYISPWWRRGSVQRQISVEAHELHKQGRYELAVLRIQTSCELLIGGTLRRLLREAHPDTPVDRLLRQPTTLHDEQTRALVQMLTGHVVQQTPWWPSYVGHLKRRNAIAHRGLEITRDDASASLRAALDLHAWLLEIQGVDMSDLDGVDEDA